MRDPMQKPPHQPVPLEKETFAKIAGFERYLISNLGRVYSTIRAGRFLSATISPQGYEYVSLMADGATRPEKSLVHRLVASAFCDGSGECVNHIDGDKRNNRAENLEWCSYGANNDHARDLGLSKAHSETHYLARLRNQDIPMIRERLASGEAHISIAAAYGIRRQTINRIASGKAWRRAF